MRMPRWTGECGRPVGSLVSHIRIVLQDCRLLASEQKVTSEVQYTDARQRPYRAAKTPDSSLNTRLGNAILRWETTIAIASERRLTLECDPEQSQIARKTFPR